jgi:hypothetical protein
MTKRDAKIRALEWVANVLASDLHTHCCLYDDDGAERSEADAERMFSAFEELRLETERRWARFEETDA